MTEKDGVMQNREKREREREREGEIERETRNGEFS